MRFQAFHKTRRKTRVPQPARGPMVLRYRHDPCRELPIDPHGGSGGQLEGDRGEQANLLGHGTDGHRRAGHSSLPHARTLAGQAKSADWSSKQVTTVAHTHYNKHTLFQTEEGWVYCTIINVITIIRSPMSSHVVIQRAINHQGKKMQLLPPNGQQIQKKRSSILLLLFG